MWHQSDNTINVIMILTARKNPSTGLPLDLVNQENLEKWEYTWTTIQLKQYKIHWITEVERKVY